MIEFWIAAASAFWLGILTSISPCPLATNIAAISFVGRRVGSSRGVLFAGLLYTVGRTLAYLALGIILVSSLLSAPSLSYLLQKYMNMLLGPILILVGMALLDMISFTFVLGFSGESLQKKVEKKGIWGALLLGMLFALSFCPISAVLFFGSLIPLAVNQKSGILLPAIFGIATGLPVSIFSILIALGASRLARAYDRVVAFERWARYTTGVIFIGVGIYYSLTFIFGLSLF